MITKKAFSFLLLALFLFNIVGYFITFKIVQQQARREIKTAIKQGLSVSELTAIQINKSDLSQLVWEEKNKEFHYKGELYDIVKTEEQTESVTYYCINDEQEEQLFEHLEVHIDEYASNNGLSSKKDAKKVHLDSIKLYFSNKLSATLVFTSNTTIFYTYPLLYTSACLEVSCPPPELV